MTYGFTNKSPARWTSALAWTIVTLAVAWPTWPTKVTADIGTANSLPFSLNTMAQPGATHLKGKLLDAHSGLPIRDAVVSVIGGSFVLPTMTNSSGEFELLNISYQSEPVELTAYHTGYKDMAEHATLIEGGTINVALVMRSNTVVLLHGIRSNSTVWEEKLDGNSTDSFRSYLASNGYYVLPLTFSESLASIADNASKLDDFLGGPYIRERWSRFFGQLGGPFKVDSPCLIMPPASEYRPPSGSCHCPAGSVVGRGCSRSSRFRSGPGPRGRCPGPAGRCTRTSAIATAAR